MVYIVLSNTRVPVSGTWSISFPHAWMVQLRHILFSDCHLDQNEVFESAVLQSLISTANFRESSRQKIFFSFSTFDFYGLITLKKAEIPS